MYKTGRICLHNEKDLFTPDYLFLYGKGFVYSKREGFVYITGKICLHLIIYFFTGKDLFTLNGKDLFTPDYLFLYGEGFVYTKREGFVYT